MPLKYKWWKVPGMPPNRKIVVEAMKARFALRAFTRPKRVKSKAKTPVAKTSKKPSTHRCTTHQRQYSATERCERAP